MPWHPKHPAKVPIITIPQSVIYKSPQAALNVSSHLMRVVWQLPGVEEEVPPPTLLRLRERALFSSWLASKPPCCSKPPKPTLPSLLFNPCTSIQQAGKPRSCCWSHHPRPLLPLIQSALPHPPSPQSHPPLTSCPPSRASLYSIYPPIHAVQRSPPRVIHSLINIPHASFGIIPPGLMLWMAGEISKNGLRGPQAEH